MGRRGAEGCNRVRLLDLWEPPAGAGPAIGCLATSFTFSAEHFEEECLSRFLGIVSAPEEGLAWVIEREERLAEAVCCAALVDRRHARGDHNLRWDLLAAQPPRGACFHPKVALLVWAEHLRVLVGSANLTENGYRRNREVVGALDYAPDAPGPAECLSGVLEFLARVARAAPDGAGRARWHALVLEARRRSREWTRADPGVSFVGLASSRAEGVLSCVRERLPSGAQPERAWVVSPFFDQEGSAPTIELRALLSQRGAATVEYVVAVRKAAGEVVVEAPRSLLGAPRGGPPVRVRFARLVPEREDLEEERERPLHAKCVRLARAGQWDAALIGSSNFTSAGLGLRGTTSNVEANLLYVCPVPGAFAGAVPAHASLPMSGIARWMAQVSEEAQTADGAPVLPAFFSSAVYSAAGPFLALRLGGAAPSTWEVRAPEPARWTYTARAWAAAGQPGCVSRALHGVPPPSELLVLWDGMRAPWPVVVEDREALPPPDELRNLTVEQLIAALTSARPLHEVLAHCTPRPPSPGEAAAELLDPHKRIDTSAFLLQRTRRFGRALTALRLRLERPLASESVLRWRLRGPIGATALADALARAATSADEQAFLLAELAWELHWARPHCAKEPCYLRAPVVRSAIRTVAQETAARARAVVHVSRAVRTYVRQLIAEMESLT